MSLLTWFLEPKFSTLHFDLLVKKYWYFSFYFLVSGSWCHTVLTFKPTESWQLWVRPSCQAFCTMKSRSLHLPQLLWLHRVQVHSKFTEQSTATQEAASRQTQTHLAAVETHVSWHSGLLENVPFTFFKLLFLTVLKKHSKTDLVAGVGWRGGGEVKQKRSARPPEWAQLCYRS